MIFILHINFCAISFNRTQNVIFPKKFGPYLRGFQRKPRKIPLGRQARPRIDWHFPSINFERKTAEALVVSRTDSFNIHALPGIQIRDLRCSSLLPQTIHCLICQDRLAKIISCCKISILHAIVILGEKNYCKFYGYNFYQHEKGITYIAINRQSLIKTQFIHGEHLAQHGEM